MLLNRFTQVGIQYLSLVMLKMRTHTHSSLWTKTVKKGTHTHCRREIFASLGTHYMVVHLNNCKIQ